MSNLRIFPLFILFLVSCQASFLFAQSNTETITTYYPAPYGVYNELSTNKLAVDVTGVGVPSEFTDMQNGDLHIGRSLIVGAGGTGFSYDELQALEPGPPTRPGDGDVLIKGDVGIGTTAPTTRLEVQGGAIKATGGLIMETRIDSDPVAPVDGQIWLRPDCPDPLDPTC